MQQSALASAESRATEARAACWVVERQGKGWQQKKLGIRVVNVPADLKVQNMINDEGTLFSDSPTPPHDPVL